MWRDELQAWSLVKDDGSLSGIFQDLHHEGHPCLWYLILDVLAHGTSNPFAMQLAHILIASFSVYIFLRFSPFNWIFKVLFVFGYFPFYEYAIKSRGYALGILFIFIVCALWKNRQKNYLIMSMFLFLLSQTSPMGIIMAFTLGVTLVVDYLGQMRSAPKSLVSKHPYLAFIIFISGLMISLWQISPPADGGYAGAWYLGFDITKTARVFSIIAKTYFQTLNLLRPISEDHHSFILRSFLDLFLSVSAFTFFAVSFINKKKILFLFLVGNFLCLASFYTKYIPSPWHYGHLFILLMVCLWLEEYCPDSRIKTNFFAKIHRYLNCIKPLIIFIILSCQMIAGIKAYSLDMAIPYSAAKETAEFIKSHGFTDMLMIADADASGSTVAGYLDKKIFYPKSQRFGVHIIWNKDKVGLVGMKETLLAAEELMEKNKQDILLILNYEPNKVDLPIFVEKVRFFTSSIQSDEKFYLYTAKYQLYQNFKKIISNHPGL